MPAPPPSRLSLLILASVYFAWLGIIAFIATMPSLERLAVLAMALVLFVWLPFWAWWNWEHVTSDPPATYATVIVAVLMIVFLSLELARKPEFIFKHGAEGLKFSVDMCVFFSMPLLWSWLRSRFARK